MLALGFSTRSSVLAGSAQSPRALMRSFERPLGLGTRSALLAGSTQRLPALTRSFERPFRSTAPQMGLADEMRAPSGGFFSWIAMKMMGSGAGADSIDAVNTMLDLQPGSSVVELGPGLGYSLKAILDTKPSQVYAIEISDLFRDELKKDAQVAAAISSGVVTISGEDAVALPSLADASVDCVFGHNVIYFLDPLPSYLAEFHRVLKPGGVLFWGVKDVAKSFDQSVYVNTEWELCKKAMEDAGFEAELGAARLEGGLQYSPLKGTKK